MTTSENDRGGARHDFLQAHGWGDARVIPFPGDASTRSYFRLDDGARQAILMDAPAARETASCPPGASVEERLQLGYTATARLAGNNIAAFAGIAEALTQRGFSAPRIEAADLDAGLAIIEDLGDGLFARLIPDAAHEGILYAAAIDALAALYRSSFPDTVHWREGGRWDVLEYDDTALIAESELFLDWYAAQRAGVTVSDDMRDHWRGLWRDALAQSRTAEPGLVLRDFHAENLIWLPEREGLARVGLLDFQDALFGHPAYDVVSLLEDLRRDVSPGLHQALKDRFVEKARLTDAKGFEAAYSILGAQRNMKIYGFCVRSAVRDGKPKYLPLLPRMSAHLNRDLAHPALAAVRAFVERYVPGALEAQP